MRDRLAAYAVLAVTIVAVWVGFSWADYGTIVLSDSPVHYFNLGESSGSLFDSGSDRDDFSSNGTTTYGVTGIPGYPTSTALSFDGSSAYLSTGAGKTTYSPFTNGSCGVKNFTFEAWIKPSSVTGVHAIWAAGTTGSDYGYLFYTNNTSFSLQLYNNSGGANIISVNSATIPAAIGSWFHFVGTIATTPLATLYVNGTSVATTSTFGTDSCNTTINPRLARFDNTSNYYFNGTLDEVAIYTSTLSAARVTAHYNAGAVFPSEGLPFSVKRGRIPPPWTIAPEMPIMQVDAPGFIVERMNKRAIRSRGTYSP